MTLTSVILPTHDRPEWLRESIDSVLAQDCDKEILVLYNDPTEETTEVLDSYGKQIQGFYSITNAPVEDAFTFLAKRAKGDYITYWSDDDRMKPGNLSRKTAIMDKDSNIGLVWGPAEVIDPNGEPAGKLLGKEFEEDHPSRAMTLERLIVGCCIPMNAAVWRRGCVNYLSRISYAPFFIDWALWMEIGECYDMGYVAEPLMQLRVHDASVTRTIGQKQHKFLDQTRTLWKHWLDKGVRPSDEGWNRMRVEYVGLLRQKYKFNVGVIEAAVHEFNSWR